MFFFFLCIDITLRIILQLLNVVLNLCVILCVILCVSKNYIVASHLLYKTQTWFDRSIRFFFFFGVDVYHLSRWKLLIKHVQY